MKGADGFEGSVDFQLGKLTGDVGALKEGQNRLEQKVDRILSRLTNGGWVLALGIFVALLGAYFSGHSRGLADHAPCDAAFAAAAVFLAWLYPPLFRAGCC